MFEAVNVYVPHLISTPECKRTEPVGVKTDLSIGAALATHVPVWLLYVRILPVAVASGSVMKFAISVLRAKVGIVLYNVVSGCCFFREIAVQQRFYRT